MNQARPPDIVGHSTNECAAFFTVDNKLASKLAGKVHPTRLGPIAVEKKGPDFALSRRQPPRRDPNEKSLLRLFPPRPSAPALSTGLPARDPADDHAPGTGPIPDGAAASVEDDDGKPPSQSPVQEQAFDDADNDVKDIGADIDVGEDTDKERGKGVGDSHQDPQDEPELEPEPEPEPEPDSEPEPLPEPEPEPEPETAHEQATEPADEPSAAPATEEKLVNGPATTVDHVDNKVDNNDQVVSSSTVTEHPSSPDHRAGSGSSVGSTPSSPDLRAGSDSKSASSSSGSSLESSSPVSSTSSRKCLKRTLTISPGMNQVKKIIRVVPPQPLNVSSTDEEDGGDDAEMGGEDVDAVIQSNNNIQTTNTTTLPHLATNPPPKNLH